MSKEQNSKENEEEKPDILDKEGQQIEAKTDERVQKKDKNLRTSKIVIFSLIWSYTFIRFFFTDIDGLLLSKNLKIDLSVYVSLRLIFFTLIIFFFWLRLGNIRFWKNLGLLFLFPIYPFSWKVLKKFLWDTPKYLFDKKYQVALFYYLEFVIGFFVDFKYIIFKWALLILSFITLFSLDGYWLVIPIAVFTFLQINHLVKRFKQTFSPIKIFRLNMKVSEEDFDEYLSDEKIEENVSSIKTRDDLEEEERVIKEMETFLLMTEFTRAFNLKIKEVVSNRTYMLSFLGKAVFSFLITMIYFGGINLALYKISSNNFKVDFIPEYFDFFYYSFFTVFPDGTDIEPVSKIAKIIRMVGVFIGVIINLLLLTVYLTISNEKYKENLEKLSTFSSEYSKKVDDYFKRKYGHDPAEGLKKIKKISSTVENAMGFLNKLSGK